MSNQVKRSAVNALVVELTIERNGLVSNLEWHAKRLAERDVEIIELRDTVDRQLKRIESLDDETWALKDRLNVMREAARLNGNDRLKLSWYQTFTLLPIAEDLEPFGVKDGVLVDAMDGEKIPTIKLVRELTGLGLKDAKDIVDKWEADGKFKKWSAE